MTMSPGSQSLWSNLSEHKGPSVAIGAGFGASFRGFFGDVGGALKGMYAAGRAGGWPNASHFGDTFSGKRLGIGGAIAGGGLLLSGMMGGPGIGMGLLAAGGAAGAAYAGGRMGVGGAVMGSAAVLGTVGAGRLSEHFDISGAAGMVAAGSMFAGGFMSSRGGSRWTKPFRFMGGMGRGLGTIPTALGRVAGGWKPYKGSGFGARSGHLLAGSAMIGSMFGVGNLMQTGNLFGSFAKHMPGGGGFGRGTSPNIPTGYRMSYPY